MSLLNRIAISNGDKTRKMMDTDALTRMNRPTVAKWNRQLRSEIYRKQKIESALLIVNKSSGHGRTSGELKQLQAGFDHFFAPISRRVFMVAESQDEITHLAQRFLTSFPGPWLLLSGGDGANRALVQGVLAEAQRGSIRLDDVRISTLRLGSMNLLPGHLGLPKEPLLAMEFIASNLFAGRNARYCVCRCTGYYPNGRQRVAYGLTMAGLGQFARLPDDIKRWRDKHLRLMHWTAQRLSVENINLCQYLTFSLRRALKGLMQPDQAELVEVRQAGRRERLRLLWGILIINFDVLRLLWPGKGHMVEPRLLLYLIPPVEPAPPLASLLNQPRLKRYLRQYEITPDRPLELVFLEKGQTTLALDEETFTAPNRISFHAAGFVRFVTGALARHGPR